jgi:L-amino acid N-acyltransferase YncA
MTACIRMATDSDAAAIADIYGPICIETPISFEEAAPTAIEMAQRVRSVTQTLPWLVLEDRDIVGYVYARPFRERAAYRWSVEVTVYVHTGHRRKGVAGALYAALFRILTLLGYFKCYAGVTVPNPASECLHEAVGFTPVGVYHGVGYKFGAWHDVSFYEMALRPEEPLPQEPRPVSAVMETAEWREALDAGLAVYRRR